MTGDPLVIGVPPGSGGGGGGSSAGPEGTIQASDGSGGFEISPALVTVNTSSTPTDLTAPTVNTRYTVISSGSKGNEIMNLPGFGSVDASRVGMVVQFYWDTSGGPTTDNPQIVYDTFSPSGPVTGTINMNPNGAGQLPQALGVLVTLICSDGENWYPVGPVGSAGVVQLTNGAGLAVASKSTDDGSGAFVQFLNNNATLSATDTVTVLQLISGGQATLTNGVATATINPDGSINLTGVGGAAVALGADGSVTITAAGTGTVLLAATGVSQMTSGTGSGLVRILADGTVHLSNDPGTVELDGTTGALNVNAPSGPAASAGDVNITNLFKINGVALAASDITSAISGADTIVTGATARSQMATVDFTATFGAITALTGTAKTQTITGLLTTDQVHCECISTPPSGYVAPNARVSASDTLELYFTTAVALGITLGSLTFRVTVIR